MKRKLLFIIATVFLVAACHNDDYMPGLPAPGNEDNETEMAEQVAGRVALGYVTYYGTSIPDAKYLTHINYAFAELYVKNGIYEKFGLQGDKSRFDKVKKIKSQYPHVKILLSFTNSVSNTDNSQDGGFSALAKSPEMRKQFAQDCKAFVSSELDHELNFMKSYIELMSLRLSGNVELKVDLPDDGKGVLVAPLLFITLIENAFKHGVSPTEPSFIHIRFSWLENSGICCYIENSYFPKKETDRSGSGIGLENLKKRLDLLYPGKYDLRTEREGNEFVAQLKIGS